MKKNILNGIEKIKKERKLPKELEKNIFNSSIANGAIGISIIILIMTFNIAANFLSKITSNLIYNVCAIIFLIFTIIMMEFAYRRDNGKLAISAMEILVLSVFTLFAPYIFTILRYKNIIYIFISLIAIYYAGKIMVIYFNGRRKYLTRISDITNIVKKESKDELAKQEIEKRKLKEKAKKTKRQKKDAKVVQNKKATERRPNKVSTTKTGTKKTNKDNKAGTTIKKKTTIQKENVKAEEKNKKNNKETKNADKEVSVKKDNTNQIKTEKIKSKKKATTNKTNEKTSTSATTKKKTVKKEEENK